MPDRARLKSLLAAARRIPLLKLTLVLLVLALVTRRAFFLFIPPLYYLPLVVRRLLYSVRAKLAAFYLYAALLPIVLMVVIFLFAGYLVLGHVAAQVVAERLNARAVACELGSRRAEATYWRARSSGRGPRAAAEEALRAGFGDLEDTGFAAWFRGPDGALLVSRGDPSRFEPLVPGWLGERHFAGVALAGRDELQLRTRVPLFDRGERFDIGTAWSLQGDWLNLPVPSDSAHVPGGAPKDAVTIAAGILAASETKDTAGQAAPQEAVLRRLRRSIQSRFVVLPWEYFSHPVLWASGRSGEAGPAIHIAFSVEAARAALLRTSSTAIPIIWWGTLTIIATVLVVLGIASVRGLMYAHAISSAVSKLDQGVRAVRRGDFSTRIQPRERDQLGALALTFNDMSERLQQLLEARAAHQVAERELTIARDVQLRLFPERLPTAAFLEVSGVCLPARTVSGDYYDFIDVPGGCDLVIADVSGKGVSAALLMASVQAALRSQYTMSGADAPDPGLLVTRLNRHLNAYAEPSRFVTLFLVRYVGDGRLLYCNAGHNPAAHVRDGRVDWLRAGGLMLGPFATAEYAATSLSVQAGDLVCLYTDGITEAVGPGGEHFGEMRLAEILSRHASQPVGAVQDEIVAQVRDWQVGADVGDDITLVLLRVQGVADEKLEA